MANREEEQSIMPVWKSYLYHLQQQAPKPRKIICHNTIQDKPPYYCDEFHGAISRDETDQMLQECDGCYLVRESQRAPGQYTLAIRFDNATKNFKLFYDGEHYVGEKRFEFVDDLVADGLITFYLEAKASDYIAALSTESNYAESPYVAYNTQRKKTQIIKKLPEDDNHKIVNTKSLTGDLPDSPKFANTDISSYEKHHGFKMHNFKGPHWCDFCANFMWGLIAQGVKCQDCGFQAHKKCSEKVPHDCMPDMKYVKRSFGVDLTTLIKAQGQLIPKLVIKCVQEIEKRGLDIEGLYRVAGFHDDVEAIKMAFDKDGESANISRHKYEDMNTITSVLKLYFRVLPIPLISFDAYYKFIDVIKSEDLPDTGPAEKVLEALRDAVKQLPPSHHHTLKFLLQHLSRVTEQSGKNMMTPENLAIVFAPTLLRSPDSDLMKSLLFAKHEQKVMETLIRFHDKILA